MIRTSKEHSTKRNTLLRQQMHVLLALELVIKARQRRARKARANQGRENETNATQYRASLCAGMGYLRNGKRRGAFIFLGMACRIVGVVSVCGYFIPRLG